MKKMVVVFAVLLTAGLVSLLAGFTPPAPAADGPGRNVSGTVFTVKTGDAEIRSLQAYIEVNGNTVSERQVAVVPDTAGKIASMRVSLGSTVRKGALVALVDPSRPGAQYSLSPVYAPVSGMVVSNPAPEGSTVSIATGLFTIAEMETAEIEALIPEREVGQLRAGLRAEVRLEAFPGEVFLTELVRLSPVVDAVSRTKKVTLRLLRDDPRIEPGMFARIKLNTRSYENVISIPQDAAIDKRGKTTVYVLAPSGDVPRVQVREVETGVSVDGELEIRNGLSAGEKVVVRGQQFLTDGAAVRVKI